MSTGGDKTGKSADKTKRLGSALRANLQRRKAQMRGRKQTTQMGEQNTGQNNDKNQT